VIFWNGEQAFSLRLAVLHFGCVDHADKTSSSPSEPRHVSRLHRSAGSHHYRHCNKIIASDRTVTSTTT
jgi:hypothetical protein